MSSKRSIPLLMDEPPILVYPSLAKAIGINKAVIMQQVHFLLNSAKVSNNQYVLIDEKWWVYNTYKEWLEYFPWLSTGGLKRMFLELEKDGFLISRQSVKNKSDRRKWYTIDYEAWSQFASTIGAKCAHEPSAQNETMVGAKSDDGYSETPSENENKDSAPARERLNASRSAKKTHEPDRWDVAIKTVWVTDGTGWLNNLKSMLFGTAKKGEWAKCKFDPPVTDPAEIVSFGEYARRRMREKNITDVPTACVTIQRWFYDFRAEQKRKANQPAGYIPVAQRTSARDFVRTVNP